MEKLLIIDGNSILNRAFYGVRPLTNSAGLQTNALFGMLTMLLKQIDAVSPDYAAIAFDRSEPTFRHKEYSLYKAGRKKMPEELAVQLPYSKILSEALGLTVLELAGYEADDLLGTVSRMAEEKGVQSYILTGDRDSLQLIGENTFVLLASNSDTLKFDREAFKEKYGIEPCDFVDAKALMGDSSDNIPGVPGIGEKTAFKLISQYKNLDTVYENLENAGLGASAKQKMADGKELAYLSYKLALIERNVPVDFTFESLKSGGIDKRKLYNLLTELEFTSQIKRLGLSGFGSGEGGSEIAKGGGSSANGDGGSLSESSDKTSGFDTKDADGKKKPSFKKTEILVEGLSSLSGKSYGFCYDGECAAFSDENEGFVLKCADLKVLYEAILKNNIGLYVFDYKNSFTDFAKEGKELECEDDIMLMAYVINPAESHYDLQTLSDIYLKQSIGEDLAEKSRSIYLIRNILSDRLKEQNEYSLYKNIELPLAAVLSDMERTGFALDTAALKEFLNVLTETEKDYANRIYMLAGKEFNINSPKQLSEVLFETLNLPTGKKTANGFSTGAEVLEKLRSHHPIVSEILEYRAVMKLRSTYAEGLLKVVDSKGRVHTSFNQTTTVTGRLSSTEPNLQNIPVRTELGREMRKFFVASNENYRLIDADYSQIELRILAHIAKDENMINAFKSGEDIHSVTASQVFDTPLDRVTPEMRKRAKAVNFGLVYGIGEFSLASDIGVSRKEAGEYIKSYFAKYTGIDAYLQGAVEAAKHLGYVETVFGRRRYIPELSSAKAVMRAFGERVAKNSPIQGTSADIIKLAMINVRRALKAEGLDARLILQVHDELIVEAHKDCAERAAEILKKEMENVVSLSVPLTVELNVGNSWYDCK